MKYTTLAELREAYRFPEGEGAPEPLVIDNDCCGAYEGDDDTSEKVFDMNPTDVLEQALALLGIPFEHV